MTSALPADRLCQRVVGCGIAGVQADDEVDLLARVVAADLAPLEAQARCPRTRRERRTGGDHVLLQVEAHDVHRAAAELRQQMMDREGEVRLAAAEVDDAQGPVRTKSGHDVVDELEKAVDLAKLVVAALPHRAVGRHHTELDEKRNGPALLEQVALAAVVPTVGGRPRGRPAQHLPPEHLPVGIGRLQQTLPVVGQEDAEAFAAPQRRRGSRAWRGRRAAS